MKKAKKPLGNSSGSCPKGCRGRIIGKKQRRYCECLESKLRDVGASGASIAAFSDAAIESRPDRHPSAWLPNGDLDVQRAYLESFGLKRVEIELVYARAVQDKDFKTIVKEQGWLGESTARRYYLLAVAKIEKIARARKEIP